MTIGGEPAKAAQSLAVVEKRQASRPKGVCVGILFQFFDWQRRFAKKKFFSKKLLPSAHPKKVTRNLKGIEKMPVARYNYIGDKNKGAFLNSGGTKSVVIERNPDMEKPGLVARLMGLESMPSLHKERMDNISSHENYDDKACKTGRINQGLGIEEMNLEKGRMSNERPRKLPKTGLSETQAVTKHGSEALKIKGVLCEYRKQNPVKLPSPVKNPRITSSKSVPHKSRLLGVATRILEPGLQCRNKDISALTYSESMQNGSGYEVTVEGSVTEKTHYIKCSHVLNKPNVSQYVDDRGMEHPPSSARFSSAPCQGTVHNKVNLTVPVAATEKGFSTIRQEEPMSLKDVRVPSECQRMWHLPTKKGAPHREEPTLIAAMKSRRVSSAASSVSVRKDFVALNRSLSGQTRPRVPKDKSSSTDSTRRSRGRRYDSVSDLRSPNRRMITSSLDEPVKNRNLCNSAAGKPRKGTSVRATGNDKTDGRISVISFTFNSPLKQDISSSTEAEFRKSNKSCSIRQKDCMEDSSLEARNKKDCPQDHMAVRGDALGSLLEQKLKELTSQEDDDSSNGSTSPKRSTSMILKELISALTSDKSLSQDCHMQNTDEAVQLKSRKEESLIELPCDANHFSPGSVLDASFSNGSCASKSLDDRSGMADFMDFSWDLPQEMETDDGISESLIKLKKDRAYLGITINLIICINRALSQLNLAGIWLSGSKLSYSKEVLLHTELLFSGKTSPRWFSTEDIIINQSLLDELESLVLSEWTNTGWFNGLMGLKEGKQGKEFLFDCLLECLELNYQPGSNFGYQRWSRLPLELNEKILVHDVEDGLYTWAGLSGMSVDEMIDWEMSHSLGKWVDFNVEAFENGCEIERDILKSMVEEIVQDISKSSKELTI
ncbi:hypothetical protein SAY87_019662 [Trapa incisa]|uniref:DUF4378 domain-containing protein n=1 Tax=Trapa incisa TaxID=236973 RepID=A0AAN7K571_9MYRT|nr:hypothetical protein SAY87_019662 [Trapa incisa]